jgi:hypothetical protein
MILLSDISLAQATLFEIGAALLLVAIWRHLRDTFAYRHFTHSWEEREHVQEQGLVSRSADEAETHHADPTPNESFKEDTHTPIKAGNLTRTASVRFVQKFDFRRHGS